MQLLTQLLQLTNRGGPVIKKSPSVWRISRKLAHTSSINFTCCKSLSHITS